LSLTFETPSLQIIQEHSLNHIGLTYENYIFRCCTTIL